VSSVFRVWSLDVWGNDEDGYTVNDRREVGKISVSNTENRTLFRALVNRDFLRPGAKVEFDGDDEFISVDYANNGEPVLQLELEEETQKSLFSEPAASKESKAMSRSNPLSSLSTGEKVGIAAAGVAALGFVGYLIWKSQQSATTTAAQLPVVQTPMPGTTPPNILAGGPTNPTGGQIYDPNLGATGPTSETTIGGQVYDPNLLLGQVVPTPGG
jgi:hypothetical protein